MDAALRETPPSGAPRPRRLAVLALGRAHAEWTEERWTQERGPERLYGRAPIVHRDPAALARAALAARHAAGGAERACVVALGDGFVACRLLVVPPLPRRELARVLVRKAATQLDADESDSLFATVGAGGPDELVLVSLPRAATSSLLAALQRVGLAPRRLVAARLAPLAAFAAAGGDRLVVALEPGACVISLLADGRLVRQDVLSGDPLASPAAANGLAQGIRTVAGFWRRKSRGRAIESVHLCGLPPERGSVFAASIEASLAGARVVVERADAGRAEHAGAELASAELASAVARTEQASAEPRADVLARCVAGGPLARDLAPRAPRRGPRAALAVLGVLAFGVLLFSAARQHMSSSRSLLEDEITRLDATSEPLIALRARRAATRARIDALRDELAAATRLGGEGFVYEELLASALAALRGRGELEALRVAPAAGGERTVRVEGRTAADPVVAAARLVALERELCAAGVLADVRIEGPYESDGDQRSGAGASGFALEARLAAERAR